MTTIVLKPGKWPVPARDWTRLVNWWASMSQTKQKALATKHNIQDWNQLYDLWKLSGRP